MNARAFPLVVIDNLVEPVRTWNPAQKPDKTFEYVDLSAVSQTEKRIVSPTQTLGADAPSRARQLILAGDVLVSTVRPNLNGVAPVTDEFSGATASTGFCVLRPRVQSLASEYLMHWVRSPKFIDQMVRQATGASYPAVSDKIIKASAIPLPPLDEQRRIAAILDQADALHRKRKRALELLDELALALFQEMFGDPSSNPRRFKLGRIGDLLESAQYGTSEKAGAAGSHPILRMGNLTSRGKISIKDLKYIELSSSDSERYTVRKGDILFNRTNSAELVGKTAVFQLNEVYAYAGYLVRARPRKGVAPEYVAGYLNSTHGKATLRRMAKSIVGMANINAREMQNIPILIPSESDQSVYQARLKMIDKHASLGTRACQAEEQLFSSLQNRAFAGKI